MKWTVGWPTSVAMRARSFGLKPLGMTAYLTYGLVAVRRFFANGPTTKK
jgi:hypothetical protein